MLVHRFPVWTCEVVRKLCAAWNTRIVANTKVGNETSPVISFNRGLPQGDALCPRLFTLCSNPVAWKLRFTEGYRLSRHIRSKVTDILYLEDLKVFAASQAKLDRVLKMIKEAMEDFGLLWNPKKCNVLNVRRGVPVDVPEGFKSGEILMNSLKGDTTYRSLRAPERLLQEVKLTLQRTTETYLQRLSVIWSSPLSDANRVQGSNQLAMPVLLYLMWSQHWCLTDLRNVRQARKIVFLSNGKHPLGLKATVYLPRALGGRGMRSVEKEYKMTKIKSAIKLCSNDDSTVSLLRAFEKNAADQGHQSLVKEAKTFAEELGIALDESFPHPKCRDNTDGADVHRNKIKRHLKKASLERKKTEVMEKRWQRKLLAARWEVDQLNQRGCFA